MTRAESNPLLDAEEDPSLAMFSGLIALGRAHRAALELAADLMEEGLDGERYEVPEEAPARMAAAEPGAPFPARYQDDRLSVVLLRGAGGVPRARLERGPGLVELVLCGQSLSLAPGQSAPTPWLDAAPEELVVIAPGALPTVLKRDPA